MSDIRESYVNNYSWSQWFFQSLMFPFFPRFDERRLEATIKQEAGKAPVEVPAALHKEFAVSLMENAECRTHIIGPLDGVSTVTVFYCHGGAYVANFMVPPHFDGTASVMKALGSCTYVLPEYPLVPTVTHESLFETIEILYRQVVSARPDQKIVVMGDSAGGGMALILSQRLAAAKTRGDIVRQPDSVILMSPWLDVSMSDAESAKLSAVDPFLNVRGLKKAGEMLAAGPNPVTPTDPAVSPLFGSLVGLPPVSVWIGTHDMLLPDSRRLRDRYKEEAVQSRFRYYEKIGLLHCFFMFQGTGTPEAIQEIAAAIREDCGLDEQHK